MKENRLIKYILALGDDMKNNSFEYGLRDMNEMTVTLTLEDDSELLCGVVAVVPVEDNDYIREFLNGTLLLLLLSRFNRV